LSCDGRKPGGTGFETAGSVAPENRQKKGSDCAARFVGRNGSKSRRGTEATATLYSILETPKLHNVNSSEYLAAAIAAADRGVALMPWDFAAAKVRTGS
jgi:hypothetical protein